MKDNLMVGIVANTHGIKGELKIYPTTDDVKRFGKLKEVIMDTGRERLDLHIRAVSYKKGCAILKFEEFDNINQVERYKGARLFVTRENAVELKKGEHFIADMLGMRVVSDEGEELGELTDVIQTGANDVYVVSDGSNELLLPAIKQCILEISDEKREIVAHIMDGLR